MIGRVNMLAVFVTMICPIACSAQCPVDAGWWVYEAPDGKAWLHFRVEPNGMEVDSLEFALHGICDASYVKRFSLSGTTITCDPWGFTWSRVCEPAAFNDGFDLGVIFTDAQQAQVVLDIEEFYYRCQVCRALEISGIVGARGSTWGRIKALYDSR